MGRYVSTGTEQANVGVSYIPSTCYQVSTHQYAYDSNECWQNRVMINQPGTYSFSVPSTGSSPTCFRVVAIGGGGKVCPTCSDFYCNFAGSGGGYSEWVGTVSAGCTVSVTVGRQQQDTSFSFVCSGGTTVTPTGGGATSRTPGTGTGGNFINSRGGCGGWGRNAQEYYGSCPSTCLCLRTTTCCGYCVVYGCMPWSHSQEDLCTGYYPGGGSAGSFMYPCGGCGGTVCGRYGWCNSNNSSGPAAGGGGGIGYINKCRHLTAYCNCICRQYGSSQQPGVCAPSVAGGGGGSKWVWQMSSCEDNLWTGLCENGVWRDGAGGWGGCDNQEGRPATMYWSCVLCMCTGRSEWDVCCSVPPKKYKWHDIHQIAGSGSAGKGINFCQNCVGQGNYWVQGCNWDFLPQDSGEGAGTGGAVYVNCQAQYVGWPCRGDHWMGVDWIMTCCLGGTNNYNKVYQNCDLTRQLVPGLISYAGTLGGSGGIGVCCFASKAGYGGGAGMYKSYIHCICWGGTYDLCNGSGAALAFPPCILDNIVSNAGSGLAIIYWKD